MPVTVTFSPIYGSQTHQTAVASLLTVDHFTILLDCGWTFPFDQALLQNLAQLAPTVNAVLISHPDLAHVGALPYAIANLNLNAPVFATLPVWRMAQMFMYDTYVSLRAQSDFDLFNLDHVDAAFELAHDLPKSGFHLLKYQQHFPLDLIPGGSEIAITPHPAGHMLGGTVWSITKHSENILYAVHLNHRRERHLNPTTLPSFTRPSHLILSATNSTTRSDNVKPSHVVDQIRNSLSRNGNVLIPVDTAGRVIELAAHLQEAWKTDPRLSRTPFVILHELASRTFDFARSMIEWMSDEVVRRFDISRENLFIFKHIKLCQSIKDLESISSPMVVLASSVSLEIGFSRVLFAQWCSNPVNSVILVDRPEPNTLYAQVYQHALKLRDQTGTRSPPLKLQVMMKGKEYLQGEELEQWREEERTRKAIEAEQQRLKEEQARLEKEAAEREKERAERAIAEKYTKEQSGPESHIAASSETKSEAEERYDRIVLAQLRRLGGVPTRAVVDTFPFKERPRRTWDDYGQEVDTERFMIGEDPGEGAPSQVAEHLNGSLNDTSGPDAAQEEIPTKYVEESVELVVNCQIAIIDCSGLSDGDSLKRLVKEVEPRHVTLIGGTAEETSHFEQYLLSNLYASTKAVPVGNDPNGATMIKPASVVATPHEMESVDITSHTSVFEFLLQDALVGELKWNEVNDSSIAFLDGIITEEPDESGKQVLGRSALIADVNDDEMDIDSADVMTSSFEMDVSQESKGHPTVFVGTIMMNTLKDKLSQAGIKAEFAGGALCVENPETRAVVLVKKVGAQQIVLEGAFSEEYLIVKDLVYDELVIPR